MCQLSAATIHTLLSQLQPQAHTTPSPGHLGGLATGQDQEGSQTLGVIRVCGGVQVSYAQILSLSQTGNRCQEHLQRLPSLLHLRGIWPHWQEATPPPKLGEVTFASFCTPQLPPRAFHLWVWASKGRGSPRLSEGRLRVQAHDLQVPSSREGVPRRPPLAFPGK